MTGLLRHGFSRGRSMATAFGSMSRRSSFRRFVPAISCSWTISAVTKAKSCATAPQEPSSSSCPNTHLNPIEQVFAKTSISYEKPPPEPSKPFASPSALHVRTMRKLLRKLRIWPNLTSSCFSRSTTAGEGRLRRHPWGLTDANSLHQETVSHVPALKRRLKASVAVGGV